MTSSNEFLKDKCVDLSDYNRYLNQILPRTHILHHQHAGTVKFTWPENPRWRLPPSWISEKCLITPYWNKLSAPNFMGRCTMAMQRWPHDQKSKLAWRYQRKVWRISASISVTITDIWTKFGSEHKYYSINTPEWPNSHNLKIQDGGCCHLEFWKHVNNSGLNKDISTKLYV